MPVSALNTFRLPNGSKVLTLNDDKSIGEQECIIPADQAVVAVEIRCAMKIAAAAGYGGGAISATNRQKIFEGIFVDASTGGMLDEARTEFLQNASFYEIARMQEQLLEKAVKGYDDATSGLTKPPVAETTTTHNFRVLVPFDVEFLEPGSIYGLGPSQFNTLRLTVRLGSDPLTAVVATLGITQIALEFWAITKQVNGDQVSPIPHLRKKNETGKLGFGFSDGMPLVLEDTNNPLASTDIEEVTVKVGDEVLVKPPATPDTISELYLANPNVGSIEDTSEHATPLFRMPDTQIKEAKTGPISVEQRVQNEDLQLRLVYFPAPTVAQYTRDVKSAALKRQPGQFILAVNKAAVDQMAVESRHLPFLPFKIFEGSERQAEQYAGLRCVHGGEPEVYIPPYLLDAAAARYINAASENNGAGNNAVMLDTIRSVADMVPGATVNGRGYSGGSTATYKEVERQILTRVQGMLAAAMR